MNEFMNETCLIPGLEGASIKVNYEYAPIDISKPPYQVDYIISGFNLKATILDVLMDHAKLDWFALNITKHDLDNMAQVITDALATKLKLKQG